MLKFLLGLALMALSCVYAVRAQDDAVPGFWLDVGRSLGCITLAFVVLI